MADPAAVGGASDGVFRIGLTMAGGSSGGLYLAGVFDFLIEALDAWEQERAKPDYSGPTHKVVIAALSGTSAGAITATLGTVAMGGGAVPKAAAARTDAQNPFLAFLAPLYDAWVERPQFVTQSDHCLFGTHDLETSKRVVSLMDSTVLKQIADDAVAKASSAGVAAKPYLATDLPVYLMLANMRGVPYRVGSAKPNAKFSHYMMAHADRELFRVTGLGSGTNPGSFATNDDSARTLPISGLNREHSTDAWKRFALCALSSGAFPAGLAPRTIEMAAESYATRKWPLPLPSLFAGSTTIAPDWQIQAGQTYSFLAVDGGTYNNESFEYTRYALMEKPPEANPRKGHEVDRAVILVDPFPEGGEFDPQSGPGDAVLMEIAKRIVPAFLNQARFKPAEIVAAVDEDVYSRYLIAPKRDDHMHTIACGNLGGIGGFLSRDWRAFDYQLGRRNCQQFLRETFAVPVNNPIAQNRQPKHVHNDPTHAVLIPLYGTAAKPVPLPAWPRETRAKILEAAEKAAKRADKLVPQLLKEDLAFGWSARTALSLWWRFSGRDQLRKAVYQAFQGEAVRRDQIAYEGRLAPLQHLDDTQRAVVGATCAGDEEYAPARKIAERCKMTTDETRTILESNSVSGLVQMAVKDGEKCYRFAVQVDDRSA